MVVHASQSTRPLDTSIGTVGTPLHGKPMSSARFKSKLVSIVLLFTFCKQSPVFPFMADIDVRRKRSCPFLFILLFGQKPKAVLCSNKCLVFIVKADNGVFILIRFNFTKFTNIFLNSELCFAP